MYFYPEGDPRMSKHVALIKAKSDGYGLYSYHKITQLGINLRCCHGETNLSEDSGSICPIVELAILSFVIRIQQSFSATKRKFEL
jgi:hypothetical protein